MNLAIYSTALFLAFLSYISLGMGCVGVMEVCQKDSDCRDYGSSDVICYNSQPKVFDEKLCMDFVPWP